MTKTFKEVQGIEEACWVGYKKVGMKKKGDRMVPNCVKEEVVDNLLGKDYVYESVADMYKGQFTKAQLAKMKQTWATKKASDVDQRTKDFVKNLDQFSQMDIKNANIKYISALIEEVQKEEFELVSNFNNIVEENEMRVLVRRNKDLKEYFSADQLERLAKAYSVMKDRTISVSNAKKLGDMIDRIPDHALNDLRKKKIPFISGLALSKMIKKKIPVTESTYEDKEEKQIVEADLSKSQIKKVHKQADDLPKKDFMKRYGKDGDAVRYATATNMVKKKLGLGEDNKFIKKGELKMNESYKQRLTSAMEHFKISSLGELKDEDQKSFFSYVDGLNEGLSAGQKKLPPALQKAILAKQGKKEVKEEDAYDKDDEKPAKPKPKKEMHDMDKKDKKDEMKTEMKEPMNAMMMKAMKMPIRAMKKMEDLVGGQKKLDKDKDGDLDAKDFAALRKTKSEAVKTGEADAEPKVKELNAMQMDAMKAKPMNAMKDMNAGYMKSNVKAPVMNNGGSDMAKVKDAPKMMTAMMKISNDKKMKNMKAMYGESREKAKRYLDTKPGSLEEAVLKSRGLVK